MAQTMQFKRGHNINLGSLVLAVGEPAFVLDTGKLYVGDGINKILINPDISTNALSADKLTTARTISLTGDITGSVAFDGSGNVSMVTTEKASGVTAGTYSKVTVDTKGNVTAGTNITASDVPTLTLAKISDVGTVASKNTGTASGDIPVLDANGKLDASVLPALAITDSHPVTSETEMLALTAQKGDVAVRSDISKSFILRVEPASVLTNWQELLTPTDVVTSVAGKTGVVTLSPSDVGLGNVANESKATMFTSPVLTGSPTAPTATTGDNTTQLATTEFVTTAVANKTTITGNAGTASQLATARNITLSGAVTGTVSFDGSADIVINTITGSVDGGTF